MTDPPEADQTIGDWYQLRFGYCKLELIRNLMLGICYFQFVWIRLCELFPGPTPCQLCSAPLPMPYAPCSMPLGYLSLPIRALAIVFF